MCPPLRLTIPNTVDSPSPSAVFGMSVAAWPAVGAWHTCTVTNPCGASCWGDGTWGALGDGLELDSPVPVVVADLASNCVEQIASGNAFSCVSLLWGGLKCWGSNDYGSLGNGAWTFEPRPVDVLGDLGTVDHVAAGREHVCAVIGGGALHCWGQGTSGQLGDGSATDQNEPVQVPGFTDVIAVAGGRAHTCAVTAGGPVYCWGDNTYGQLGDGTTSGSNTAVPVSGIANAEAVTTGDDFSCALLSTGAVQCWGRNNSRQLGDGTTTDRALPADVIGL